MVVCASDIALSFYLADSGADPLINIHSSTKIVTLKNILKGASILTQRYFKRSPKSGIDLEQNHLIILQRNWNTGVGVYLETFH